jgi:hypothetical protein
MKIKTPKAQKVADTLIDELIQAQEAAVAADKEDAFYELFAKNRKEGLSVKAATRKALEELGIKLGPIQKREYPENPVSEDVKNKWRGADEVLPKAASPKQKVSHTLIDELNQALEVVREANKEDEFYELFAKNRKEGLPVKIATRKALAELGIELGPIQKKEYPETPVSEDVKNKWKGTEEVLPKAAAIKQKNRKERVKSDEVMDSAMSNSGWEKVSENYRETTYGNKKLACLLRIRHTVLALTRPVSLEWKNNSKDFPTAAEAKKYAEENLVVNKEARKLSSKKIASEDPKELSKKAIVRMKDLYSVVKDCQDAVKAFEGQFNASRELLVKGKQMSEDSAKKLAIAISDIETKLGIIADLHLVPFVK